MRKYINFEIKKLMSRWLFGIILILAVLLISIYTYNFFEIILQRYAIIHQLNPKIKFAPYFFGSLSGHINLILIIGCAIVSTLVWDSETPSTLQMALRLTPGKVHLLLMSKVILCLVLLAITEVVLALVVTWKVISFVPMLKGNFQFTKMDLVCFLSIQFIWIIPILLLNVCWYVWLGERAIVVFIFAIAGVYLLSFIGFTPFSAFLSHSYRNASIQINELIWLFSWSWGLFFFLKNKLINHA